MRLAEKPFRVLLILVEGGGELATREELQKKLWPGDTVVDFEHGINTAIKVLRRALGDSAAEIHRNHTAAWLSANGAGRMDKKS